LIVLFGVIILASLAIRAILDFFSEPNEVIEKEDKEETESIFQQLSKAKQEDDMDAITDQLITDSVKQDPKESTEKPEQLSSVELVEEDRWTWEVDLSIVKPEISMPEDSSDIEGTKVVWRSNVLLRYDNNGKELSHWYCLFELFEMYKSEVPSFHSFLHLFINSFLYLSPVVLMILTDIYRMARKSCLFYDRLIFRLSILRAIVRTCIIFYPR